MVFTDGSQVTPEWLTARLRAQGRLSRGEVAAIAVDAQAFNKGYLSNIARLRVTYSAEAVGERPEALFLKMSKPGLHPELWARGRHEIEFYQRVAAESEGLPVPRCYDAAWDSDAQVSHLLLDDLSATHFQRPLPLPPSREHCLQSVAGLAQLHARWWNDPRLGSEIGTRLTEAQAAQSLQRLHDSAPTFFDYLGDGLLPRQRQVYDRILASPFLSNRAQRLTGLRQVTVIHGDAHSGNCLLPRDEGQPVVLVDWHLWDVGIGALDLAFMIALHWPPSRRAWLERALLEHYYQALRGHGVTDYRWDDLWRDYRESVIIMTLIPIGQQRRGSPAGVIWFGTQDSLAAFEDLQCDELL